MSTQQNTLSAAERLRRAIGAPPTPESRAKSITKPVEEAMPANAAAKHVADFQPMSPALLTEVKETIARNRAQAPAVIRLSANAKGRDFIVGDIHGAFNLVRQAMRAVNFDQSKDRLFACGDLIDRGGESPVAARFLAASFVHSIIGNHEHDLLDVYSQLTVEGDGEDELTIQALAHINFNGMRWLEHTDPHERAAVLRAISKLPKAIEVETPRGIVGIIHGEVPIGMDWKTFRQGLIDKDPATTEACLTGRTRSKRGTNELIQGIDRIFCGHTPQFEGAQRLGNVFFIDSGAVFSQMDGVKKNHPQAALTMAGLSFATTDLNADPRFAQVVDHALGQARESTDIRLLDGPDGTGPFNSSWLTTGEPGADLGDASTSPADCPAPSGA